MNLFLPSKPKKCPSCGSLLSYGVWGQEDQAADKCDVCGIKLD